MKQAVLSWKDARVFSFVRHEYLPAQGELRLVYAFDTGPELVETITFPDAPWPEPAARRTAFGRAAALLHLVAGVSYYKAAVPPRMDTAGASLDRTTADFMQGLYTEGLAELAYRNGIELQDRVRFEPGHDALHAPPALELPERALVAMGGGKDSLVSLEVLREAGIEIQPACVGEAALIGETVSAAELPLLRIRRKLAPELRDMNAAGALNGHVPVTAINSAILLCAALLYGYRYVVFSNERSADEATLKDARGRDVNHQYSKGLAFERSLRAQVAHGIGHGLEYFSLLRPLDEVRIAQRFSRMERYHRVFSSCNRNFHLDGSRTATRWCGDCPKCRFTALVLAPWLSREALAGIMGRVPLQDEQQVPGFRELCGLGADKPFECVGTVDESRAALCALADHAEWKHCAVVKALGSEPALAQAPSLEALLARRGPHCIPPELRDRVAL